MTEGLFVDTSAWYPLADRSHAAHGPLADALKARVSAGARIVTTNLVLAESQALIVRRAGREVALRFVTHVRQPPNLVMYSTPEREDAAVFDWLERYADQGFSFTDAVSFAVMTELEISEALTLDGHFATAGFAMVTGSA